MRLEDGLEHDFVEALLLDLAVCFGPPLSSRRWPLRLAWFGWRFVGAAFGFAAPLRPSCRPS